MSSSEESSGITQIWRYYPNRLSQPKTVKILKICETSQRFTDLKKAIGITDMGLSKDLRALQNKGLLAKTDEGRYVLTDLGKGTVDEIQAVEKFLRRYRERKNERKEYRDIPIQTAVSDKVITFTSQGGQK